MGKLMGSDPPDQYYSIHTMKNIMLRTAG